MSVQKESNAVIHYGDPAVTGGVSVFDKEFDKLFYYDGTDLGLTYQPEESTFRLWAPTASEAYILLYPDWQSAEARRFAMTRDVKGTWLLKVGENLQGMFYTYQVLIGDQWNEAVDPYAAAVGVNGDRAYILDMASTDPKHWTEDKPPLPSPLDAVIYELHVRDYTIHPDSGVKHRGKFKGLAETGTRGPGGIRTGLDHIVELGATHVELLPIYDFATESVDETRLHEPQYNWGYDPKNYNAPEGSYSTDPYVPEVRIRELKQLIQTFHDQGLRVIMDVVYNHVYDGYLINFTKLVPGYYLRYTKDGKFSNGSGCGNDTASERPMMRKFIVESVLHWVKEYRVDGFRFDLMGLLDVETMNEIRTRLDEIDPSIITIGEGWVMNTELDEKKRANQQQAAMMPRIAHFNDGFRDAVKGDIFHFEYKGFVSGGSGLLHKVKQGIVGGIPYSKDVKAFASEPDQCVNYVECHDNHTLWDKIMLSTKGENDATRRDMHRLSSAMILTSQGIPFLHAGQEYYRSKNGVENSYNASDEVNRLDWGTASEHQDGVKYIQRLVQLRKNHPAFRLRDAASIRKHLRFEPCPEHAVAFTLRDHAGGDPEKHIFVLYYAGRKESSLALPELGEWKILLGEEHITRLTRDSLVVEGIGAVILSC
ncbi:type I pullulanase [Paenibacillus sp. p3-SID867]|uniref:type I pullulanase n=1 Tax=Paenibacillus sp. p3-SID867 TaxID=2916363 RepID=UPI0021A69AA5|nr:type I pullulanase [Paenibacillus sp. p3-SID867]MCT1398803.1 type I pullulanase [Paenibacillus sp. p3-SID867]